jgi:DNA-binding NarL/FixJ family response regulator
MARTDSDAITIVIADDHRSFGEAMQIALDREQDFDVIQVVGGGDLAVTATLETEPDVVLMDLRMPRLDGIEAIRRLTARGERPRAIALTTYADDASVLGALRAGARGYLTKDAGAEEIRAAVEAVTRGDVILDPAAQRHVVAALSEPPPPAEAPEGLTPREAEVLGLIAAGLTNTEIAERLVVSAATVKSHVNHIFAKIGARDRAQAVVYAYEHGLAEPGAAGPA